ncbi:hypothetical protein ACIRRA_42975 [Nocardia sp. NPDC101769]|uniref:hypothetical protein n=1 Tax=Nocardia sp. NPDC101769 TaxID=3364333 RepID=UPI00382FB789
MTAAVELSDNPANRCTVWTFPKQIADLPYHEFSSQASADDEWSLNQGGVKQGVATFAITVTTTSDSAVVIQNLRLKTLSKTAPVHGVEIRRAMGCGGVKQERNYDGDLNGSSLKSVDPPQPGVGDPPKYTVTKTDPEIFEVLIVDSSTTPCLDNFEFQLDWTQGNTTSTLDIRSKDKKPLQLNNSHGSSPDPTYYGEDGTWVRTGS